MYKVLVSDNISKKGIDILKKAGMEVDFKPDQSRSEFLKTVEDYDGIIVRSMTILDKEALEKASGEADADLEFIDNDIQDFRHEMIEGVDYEVAVNRQSILQIKDKLD